MTKVYWLIVLAFFTSLNCIAQTQEKEYWEALLQNNRIKALEEFKKQSLYSKSSDFISKRLKKTGVS